jgi:putative peptidoglycan lipid II flippase
VVADEGTNAQLPSPRPHVQKKRTSYRWTVWQRRVFRFRIESFRPGGEGLSLRRFSIAEAALLLMLALIASRGLGVVRQSLFNMLFGTGPQANAYIAASRLPEAIFGLISAGTLTHAFIPVFLSYERDHGQREAWRLASLVFNILLVSITFLLLLGELFAPTVVSHFLVPGYSPAEQALTTTLTRIMLVQPLILGLGAITTAILNSKRQFLLPALSIAIYNVGLIVGLLVTLLFPKVGIYGPTYGVLLAAAFQVMVQLPGLLKQGARYVFIWDLKNPGLHEVLRLLIPNLLTVGVVGVTSFVETAFASYLPDRSSLAAIHNAHTLYALPVALIGQAIGQALLPYLVVQATAGRYVRMRQTVLQVLAISLLLTVLTAILLWLGGKPIIHLFFRHGAFTRHAVVLTNLALLGYAVGLPGVVAGELFTRSFVALKDTKTPLFVNIFGLAARYGLIVLLLGLFRGQTLILAIPLAVAGSMTAEAILLYLLLSLRLYTKVKADKGMQRLQRRRLYEARRAEKSEPARLPEAEEAKLSGKERED